MSVYEVTSPEKNDTKISTFWLGSLFSRAAFMLILRGQNQRFETLIQNADSKRPSREGCSCFPREEDDFVSMHCALFEAIVRAQVNRKGVYMTSFKRGYNLCDFAFMSPPESAFCSNHDRKRTFLGCVHAYFAKAESAF